MECIFDSDFVTHTVYSLYWVDKIDKYKKTKNDESKNEKDKLFPFSFQSLVLL